MSVPFAVFGPGVVLITRTDTAVPVTVNVGYSNEFSIDLSGSEKPLYGQNQFPLLATRGTVKATGKIKAATISGLAWNAVFFGNAFAAGRDVYYLNEVHTTATTSITASNAPLSGITSVDLGMTYAATGIPLVRVASGPTQGQYSFAAAPATAAVYTINTADENTALNINYSNFVAAAGGQQLQVTNQLLGTNPTFQLDFWANLNQPAATPFAVRLFSCIGSKISMAAKLEDYLMPDIEFAIFANASGQIMNIDYPQIS